MEITTFKILKKSVSNGGKTNVLSLGVGITIFGIENAKYNTYYIGGLSVKAMENYVVGQELKDSFENYWQVKRPYFIEERNQWVILTWLHPKVMYPNGMPPEAPNPAYEAFLKSKQAPAAVAA